MPKDAEKQFVNISFAAALLKRIDDFRFKHRFDNRTDAIRWLLQAALDAKLAPKGE
jgi:metal-responsive CopG/Arc/MetJ family transcriptional regulator